METEPLDVFFNGVDVFVVFFFGVGVVETQVAQAVVNIRQTEVQADGFGVTDVQVAVGFGREAGLDGFVDDGADEMVVRELVFIEHNGSLLGRDWVSDDVSIKGRLKRALLYPT